MHKSEAAPLSCTEDERWAGLVGIKKESKKWDKDTGRWEEMFQGNEKRRMKKTNVSLPLVSNE